MTLNIHMLSAVAQHQPAAKASQLSLSDLEAGIGRREMLRHSIIQQRSYLSFYFYEMLPQLTLSSFTYSPPCVVVPVCLFSCSAKHR